MSTRKVSLRSRVVWKAAAVLLSYPDQRQRSSLDVVRTALADVGADTAELSALIDELLAADARIEAEYVQEFDLSRRHSLHLTYWTDGDTRRRGDALSLFKEAYRSLGAEFDQTELPDYLPMVLEFGAVVSPGYGYHLLQRYRPSLELLRLALVEDGLRWAPVVALVCSTLPGASPETRADAMALAGLNSAQPEQVGLDPYPTGHLPVRVLRG